jgi:hypothetical protein
MGSQEPQQQGDGGRLPGPVRAQEREGFAPLDLEVQVIESEVPAVTAYDPVEAQGEVALLGGFTLRAGAARKRWGAFSNSRESVV